MGAHAKSAEILKISGAFVKNPKFAREDMPGAAPLDGEAPARLTEPQKVAWRELLGWLPRMAITQTERGGLMQMARIWAALDHVDPLSAEFKKLDDSFRNWCMQMGMTLQARIKMGSSGQNQKPQKFEQLKERQSA